MGSTAAERVIGAMLVVTPVGVLPFGMTFAAGAMLFVVVEELIPETVRTWSSDITTLGFIAGFTVMMSLDAALGGT